MNISKLKEKLKKISEHVIITIVLLFCLFLCFLLMRGCEPIESPDVQLPALQPSIEKNTMVVDTCKSQIQTIEDSIYSYIFELRIEHPHIVMAQCVEESGNFTSRSFKEGHNCTGMKVPYRRATLCKGSLFGHARFDSWQECLKDYAIWQNMYCSGKTEDEYFAYLDRVYAEKEKYSTRLKRIIKEKGY